MHREQQLRLCAAQVEARLLSVKKRERMPFSALADFLAAAAFRSLLSSSDLKFGIRRRSLGLHRSAKPVADRYECQEFGGDCKGKEMSGVLPCVALHCLRVPQDPGFCLAKQ